MRQRAARFAPLVVSTLFACSYDWSVPASSIDASVPVDATIALDSSVPPPDASLDALADAPSTSDANDCATLRSAVESTKANARRCTSQPTDCASSVQDQCGCVVFVAQTTNQATADYLSAIDALKAHAATCSLNCPASCPTPPTSSLCVAGNVDGGIGTTCNP